MQLWRQPQNSINDSCFQKKSNSTLIGYFVNTKILFQLLAHERCLFGHFFIVLVVKEKLVNHSYILRLKPASDITQQLLDK